MTDRYSAAPPVAEAAPVGSASCPRVADLINYALGQAASDDRQRVEAHLNEDCNHCRGWVEKASRFRTEPWPNATGKDLDPPESLDSPTSCSPSDQTPIPASSIWQKQAFRDLEQRLRLLEEG